MVRASYDQKPYRRMLMETLRRVSRAQPEPGHQLRPQGARRDPGLARLAGDRDQRGRRGRRDPRRHQVQPGLGAQPRAPPPDRDRPGVDRADGDGGRGARRDHRVRRRRLELRGARVPVGRPAAARRGLVPGHRRRARGGPVAHPRRLHLRLRRHRPDDAAGQDAHPRLVVRAGPDPRGRAALPRHGAAGVAAQGPRRRSTPGASTSGPRSRSASSSRGPRGSCRPPRARTRSRSRSTRRSRPRSAARPG